jgi:hypothetical protein
LKAVLRRRDREGADGMFSPRKPFLFAERHDPPLPNQGCRRVGSFEQKAENNRTAGMYFECVHCSLAS